MPAYPVGPAIQPAGATVNLQNDRFVPRSDTTGELGASHTITAGAASSSITIADTCRRVMLACHGNPVAFRAGKGAQTAVATDHYLHTAERITISVPYGATIAAIRTTGSNGSLYVSELL